MAEFPPNSWLGYSLNMATAKPPVNSSAAIGSIQKDRRILNFDPDNARPIDIDGQTYSVPRDIAVSQNIAGGETFTTFSSGEEATTKFESDPSLMPRLLSLAGGTSVIRSITTNFFRSDRQYAFYSLRQPRYSATLSNFDDLFNSAALLPAVRELPPFSGQNQSAVAQYRTFFQTFGSHVVTSMEFGSAYRTTVWAARTRPDVNDAWTENVKADCDGIPSGGQFDEKIKQTSQYGRYLDLRERDQQVSGGDLELAVALARDPKYQTFQEWKRTGGQKSTPIYFSLVDIWTLMKNSDNIELVRAAIDCLAAYEWIVDHPSN
ncbi:hypothetical protein PQX77_009210 [Marasmius sp. AFHP31]|nr:hypothetical protein PQX77_009210 [Marasmius sp. AFHP31]